MAFSRPAGMLSLFCVGWNSPWFLGSRHSRCREEQALDTALGGARRPEPGAQREMYVGPVRQRQLPEEAREAPFTLMLSVLGGAALGPMT